MNKVVIFILVCFLVACDSSSTSTPIPTEIQVTSEVTEVPAGVTLRLTATAYYADGSTSPATDVSNWSVSDDSLASISSDGLLIGKSTGDVISTAEFKGVTGSITITVTPAILTSTQITPGEFTSIVLGNTQKFTAVGIYSDDSSHDISLDVSWLSSVPTVATIDSEGTATGISFGNTRISATLENVSAREVNLQVSNALITAIDINPSVSAIGDGTEQQYQAMATYTDDTVVDISNKVTWKSSNTEFASINSSGLASAESGGLTQITATSQDVSSNTSFLIVTPAKLTEVNVTPTTASLAKGTAQQYKAVASFSDGTEQDITFYAATGWQSSNLSSASITPSGVATGIAAGESEIKATYEDVSSNNAALIVTIAQVTAIEITTPTDMLISKGASIAYTAFATFTDDSTHNVSRFRQAHWASDTTSAATISLFGIATGVGSGETGINASNNGQKDTVDLIGTSCKALPEDNLSYVCPLTVNEMAFAALGVFFGNVEDGVTGPNGLNVATLDWFSANNYCGTVNHNGFSDWRLPLSNELIVLFNRYDGADDATHALFTEQGWPVGVTYWTGNSGAGPSTHRTVSMSSAASVDSNDADLNYVSCVRSTIEP